MYINILCVATTSAHGGVMKLMTLGKSLSGLTAELEFHWILMLKAAHHSGFLFIREINVNNSPLFKVYKKANTCLHHA